MQCSTPISIADPSKKHKSQRLTVPCGKCGACKHNRRASWAFRLLQELKVSKTAYFITITYSDENIPYDPTTGIITLRKRHLQKFIKRLRKEHSKLTDHKLRYYAVGEYGSKTNRPHYHAIMFNLYPSLIPDLDRIWKNGFIHVGNVNDKSIMYVSKYHVNANKNQDDQEPEFAIMSRRPGIGSNYIEKTKDWHRENQYFHVINNGFPQSLPRFYRDKMFYDIEKKLHAEKVQIMQDENLNQKITHLEKRGIEKPESHLQKQSIYWAKKVKKKAQDSDKL